MKGATLTEQAYTARQSKAGTKGGQETKKRHGTKFFAKIAKDRWKKHKKKVLH